MFKQLKALLFFIVVASFASYSQVTDQSWLSAKLQVKLNENWQIALKPIQRTDLNKPSYTNTSIDASVTRKLNKQFSAQLLIRRFLIPGESLDRTFFWANVIHKIKFNEFSIKNTLRHHWGLDFLAPEADFIRWIPNFAWQFNESTSLFIQSDVFLRLNQFNKAQRIRYQGGINSKITKSLALSFQYWWQESVNVEPAKKTNIFSFSIVYNVVK